MVEKLDCERVSSLEERIGSYRRFPYLDNVGSRVAECERSWATFREFGAGGDRQLAAGALRAAIDDAIGLAATPAASTDEASRKVAALLRSQDRLGSVEDPGDALGWNPMLSAAASTETWRWGLQPRDAEAVAAEPSCGEVAATPNPRLEASLRRIARDLSFDAAVRAVAIVAGDVRDLACVDVELAKGARFELLTATLRALAFPIETLREFAEKDRILQLDPAVFEPIWLILPMVAPVVSADMGLFPVTIRQSLAMIRMLLAWERGRRRAPLPS